MAAICDYDAISIREMLFGKRIEQITRKPATLLVDPVFLLEQSEWNKISNQIEIDKGYILLYMMQSDELVYELAQKIKRETKRKVVEISRYGFMRGFVDKLYVDVGPREFIGLLQNAGYVCTNSYHGVVFSIIFEKELYLIKCRRFQERMNTLNKIFDLSDSDDDPMHHIMYSKQHVKNIIQKERDKAYCYLKENLIENND